MESKNFIIKKIKKGSEPKLYIFYNLTKNQGIKRMRPKNPSNIQIGEIVKMLHSVCTVIACDITCFGITVEISVMVKSRHRSVTKIK